MRTPEGFPHDLLDLPIEARLAYFEGKTIAHPRLIEADDALTRAIRQPAGASLILVYGPTGVGKTTLRLRIQQRLIEAALPELGKDSGRIPVVAMEAVSPDSGSFSWRDHYHGALVALDEPLVDRKVDFDIRSSRHSGINPKTPNADLRRALEQALRHRRPSAFIIDEAQHFKKMASGRRLLDQMDTLKSLAAMTGTLHVLIGTYELLGLANLSAQLNRRSTEIHFPRYLPDRVDDIAAFKNVLHTFQHHLPLAEEPDLVGRWEDCYERSLGCVGLLKTWLTRALAAALENRQPRLGSTQLDRHAEPTRKLSQMAREMKEGEELLAELNGERDELRTALGLGAEASSASACRLGPGAEQRAGPARARAGRRVGQRRATRDPVGVKEHAVG